jgi:hypothetical protein
MTEQEWLECNSPEPLLWHVEDWASARKLRLFACSCCRLIWHLLTDVRAHNALVTAEQFADGHVDKAEVDAASAQVNMAVDEVRANQTLLYFEKWAPGGAAVATACAAAIDTFSMQLVESSAGWAVHAVAGNYALEDPHEEARRVERFYTEERKQASLARDIFGNPFRPVILDPLWLTPTVKALAAAAYDDRTLPAGSLDPDRLGILADALEDAGCDDAAILGHLRGPGPHFRGCWVLDLLLGKK